MPDYTTYPVLAFPPNWENGVTERLEWKTDVLVSEVGVEQRVSRRLTPRRSYEATFLINRNARAYFEALMTASQPRDFLIPLWPNVTTLTATASAGTDTLSLDTMYREYWVGGPVIIRGPNEQVFEVGQVLTVTPTSLQLISNLASTWPAGTKIYPAGIVRLADIVQGNKKLDTLFEVTALFSFQQANPGPSSWSPRRYRDGLLYATKPDDSEDLSRQYVRTFSTLDNETGLPDRYDMLGKSQEKTSYRWAFAGRKNFDDFRRFLYYLKGRAKGVYVPTFMSDLILANPIASGEDFIDIQSVQYLDLDLIHKERADLRIESNGIAQYRRVVGVGSLSPGIERLTLNAPVGSEVGANGQYMISYVQPSRLDQDSIEIHHATDIDGLTTCQVTWANGVNLSALSGLTTTPYPLYVEDGIRSDIRSVSIRNLSIPIDSIEASGFSSADAVLAVILRTQVQPPEGAGANSFTSIDAELLTIVHQYAEPPEGASTAITSIGGTLDIVVSTVTYTSPPEGASTALVHIAATLV